ncbi:MAG: hypothetical protein J6125_02335 [Clostridia bacterium]|nr:hypothetical protein [Clostridia bacterium]
MRYDAKKNRVCLDVTELILRALGETVRDPCDEEARTGRRLSEETPLVYTCEERGLRYEITGRASEAGDGRLTLTWQMPHGMKTPGRDVTRRARGEAFVCGHILAVKTNAARVPLTVVYRGDEGETSVCEEPGAETLAAFFEKTMTCLAAYHAEELDRVCRRLPTLARAVYPYPALREGQEELIASAYSAMRAGRFLFACAPTGIGKTVSVLYPAIRALGEGVFEKIFYLTPKNNLADVAIDALRRLREAGAQLFGVCVVSKETICPARLVCREEGGRCRLSRTAPTRETDAAVEMLRSGAGCVGRAEILAAAEAHKVCPYELSLRLAELADVVVCDYNYLFDLRVRFRRFFSTRGPWCFLVDEAHDLVERAAASYSVALDPAELVRMGESVSFLPHLPPLFHSAAEGLRRLIEAAAADSTAPDKDGVPCGFGSSRALPESLPPVLSKLCAIVSEAADEPPHPLGFDQRRALRRLSWDLGLLCDKLALYGRGWVTFFRLRGESRTLEALCLDPSEVLRACLSKGRCGVLFSATLAPVDYYRAVLGGRPEDPVLELPSPFDPAHLCLTVMDKISCGYSSRASTLRDVVRTILTTVKAKPGNYMVFCPSFAYMDAVCEAVRKAVPGLPTLAQKRSMSREERRAFLDAFQEDNKKALIGFCVTGGVYGEGVDLVGRRLIGAVIVGVGLPSLSDRREAMRDYFEERYEEGTAYAYVYPGMNRVMQAAGRVIRTEADRGVVVLIDDRFSQPTYRKIFPLAWRGLQFAGDTTALARRLELFWKGPAAQKPAGP